MQQLSELRYVWSSVQHQRETLQTIYACHAEVVKNLSNNPMRYSPIFHLEDFFDRYAELGTYFDSAHISFADILLDPTSENYTGHDIYAGRTVNQSLTINGVNHDPSPAFSKRKGSTTRKKHLDLKLQRQNSHPENSLITPDTPHLIDQTLSSQPGHQLLDNAGGMEKNSFMPHLTQPSFSPPYVGFSSDGVAHGYDPMFGMNGTANGSMYDGLTPSGESEGEAEKDPFLSLLEQLAENEGVRGGPSELDFFLGGASSG